ncbi:hypothetical protein ACHAW6_007335 [Cyclotella cf. meneghiniana]
MEEDSMNTLELSFPMLTGGDQFLVPNNPGPYPSIIDPDPAVCERQVAKHKAELLEFEMHCAVEISLRNGIVKCVDEEWIKELRSETMGYMHHSPHEMIDYLYCMGGDLDHMDIAKLNLELLKPWDHVEAPATMFARGDKYE